MKPAESWGSLSKPTTAGVKSTARSVEHAFSTAQAFTVSELTITPAEAQIGDEVTVQVVVTNNLDSSDTYDLWLRVGDAQESAITVTLAAGEKRRVSFTTTRYTSGLSLVDVNGATGYLTVRDPAPQTSGGFPIVALGILPLAGVSVVAFLLRRRRHRAW